MIKIMWNKIKTKTDLTNNYKRFQYLLQVPMPQVDIGTCNEIGEFYLVSELSCLLYDGSLLITRVCTRRTKQGII